MEIRITKLHDDEKQTVRNAVRLAARYWPNAHLGEMTPRQDIHDAFVFIRASVRHGQDLTTACVGLERSAYRHADM